MRVLSSRDRVAFPRASAGHGKGVDSIREESPMSTKLWLTALAAVLAALGVASALSAAGGGMGPGMGPMTRAMRPAFHGFYDGHKDTFLSADVSDAAKAREMHVNFSASL